MQVTLAVILSSQERPKPMSLNLVTFESEGTRAPSFGGGCRWSQCPKERTRSAPQGKTQKCGVTIITTSTGFDSSVVMLFLTLVRFHEIKIHRQKWTFDLFFLFFMSLMKIKGQDSSGKAGGPRVGGREGVGRGLGGGTEGERGAARCVPSGGTRTRGQEDLRRLWGQWWERLPWASLGPCPE